MLYATGNIAMYSLYVVHACLTLQNAVDNVRIVLVGNKIDLENQREVSEKRGKKVDYGSVLFIRSHLHYSASILQITKYGGDI